MREPPDGAALRERPEGPTLLDAARRLLLDELLPLLPDAKRYEARMIAGAMAIAARDAAADRDAEAALLDELGPGGAEGLALLCREIRAGAHDPGAARHTIIRAWLDGYVRLRLAISNPRALGES